MRARPSASKQHGSTPDPQMVETIYEMLLRHEGLKRKPYQDTVGKITDWRRTQPR